MHNNSPEPQIDLDTLQGSRYTIAKLKPVLEQYIDITNNKVSPAVAEEIRKLLEGRQTHVMTLKNGGEARLMLINTPQGLLINPLTVQARLSLREKVMGYTLTENDKAALEQYGHLGRQVFVQPDGETKPFRALIGMDIENKKIMVLNVEKFILPDRILGVPLTQYDKEQLKLGHPIKKDNLINKAEKEGATFTGFIRINPVTGQFKYDLIKAGSRLAESPTNAAAADAPTATPLLDQLNLPQNQQQQQRGKLLFDNGTSVLVITQKDQDNLVVKVSLPDDKVAPQIRQVFNLPLLLNRELAERVARLAKDLDRNIGKGKPLLPAFQDLPPYLAKSLPVPAKEPVFKPVRQAMLPTDQGAPVRPDSGKAIPVASSRTAENKSTDTRKLDKVKTGRKSPPR